MNLRISLPLVSMIALSLTACGKMHAAAATPGAPAPGTPVAHSASQPAKMSWTLVSATCATSGKDIWAAPSVGGTTLNLKYSETLEFTATAAKRTSTFTASNEGAAPVSESYTVQMDYALKTDVKGVRTIDTKITAVDSKNLDDKLGITATEKVGATGSAKYVETADSLTLTRASTGECADANDQVVNLYK